MGRTKQFLSFDPTLEFGAIIRDRSKCMSMSRVKSSIIADKIHINILYTSIGHLGAEKGWGGAICGEI